MLTVKKLHIRLFALLLMLLAGGMTNRAWAATVTYHILTLPIDSTSRYNYHMRPEIHGHRLEAVKVVVPDQSNVRLPDHYKSPLATGFKYYKATDVTISANADQIYENNGSTKGFLYDVNGGATPIEEGEVVTESDYYVIYEYNASNTIVQLNGSVRYNIGVKNKGFFALNRGRNNRPAVLPAANVTSEMLTSEDFMIASVTGSGVNPYWKDNNNKNKEADVSSQFHFLFKFEGLDPYNIIIRTAYDRDNTYIEKNEGSGVTNNFVYKWYKGGSLFASTTNTTNNAYIASDEHRLYQRVYDSNLSENPTNLTDGTDYKTRLGYFHGQSAVIWNSVALLNNYTNTGYVFMGTRTVNNDGTMPNSPYYLNERNSCNNLYFNQANTQNASNNLTIEGLYPVKTINFKVVTPFNNVLTASIELSEYTVKTKEIVDSDIPASLKRKYCNINGYYKDAACTQAITKYSELGDGSDIYLGYEVSSSIPFNAITPAASYTDATWKTATWYELTDAGSTEENGKKIKYDGANFKNNGSAGENEKTSEFAFIGDPYELRVISRSLTSGATPYYVGATGTPPATSTDFTANSTATEGYIWDIPNDATSGSFLLRKYNDTGYWNWDAGSLSEDITYGTNATYNVPNSNAQTITFNISGLTVEEGNYIKVTKGGTDEAQVIATTPTLSTGIGAVSSDGKATVTATILGRGDGNKTFTLTITEYNSSNAVVGTATVITINQNEATAYAGGAVGYSTTSSTRVKVLELPKRTYTYKIVDLAGNVAAKASVSQTIYSPLSLASIPSIIVSPLLVGETLTFYSNYSGSSRTNFSDGDIIDETPNENHDIFVKYTTADLINKSIKLNEDQDFYVKLNGKYLYYDSESDCIKSSSAPEDTKPYKWLLRNRDPYAMLIDNLGAREDMSVSGRREEVHPYDDNGGTTTTTRDMGAWVQVDGGTWGDNKALTFTTVRASASHFIAKSNGAIGSPIYEVMAADGNVDASTTYYNIGRPEDNVIKIYSNDTEHGGYLHGNDVLKFELEINTIIKYHLIDKNKEDLLQVNNRSLDLFFPVEYQSPLVSTYHYWKADAFVDADPEGGTDFNFNGLPTELTSVGELTDAQYNTPASSDAATWTAQNEEYKKDATTYDNMIAQVKSLTPASVPATYYFRINSGEGYYSVVVTDGHKTNADIYVTYDTDAQFGFGTRNPYTLKFLNGKTYKLEDGNDRLTTEKLQAMYPYCNGDGNLNIYGQRMHDEQMDGGSSTRPRWVWFMESEYEDPYHVKIHSRSTISYNGTTNSTYLQTYAVHFNQDTGADANKQRIVTGGNLAGVSKLPATEYMILGEVQGESKRYKLLTTYPVAADENGDGEITAAETVRRNVTSFEQYWKTYNMLKQCVLGIDVKNGADKDEFSENPETFVMPSSKWAELKAKLGSGEGNLDINDADDLNYVDGCSWHSYGVVANALRWNGFDDTGKAGTKKVEQLEHWFQTFDMGDGIFEIESADIPPVLVLLDLHGWEIMRKTIPAGSPDPEKIAALKVYDSPLVKEYHFYSNATKAANCHKYILRLNDKNELRDEIKVDGKPFTSNSLGTLPTMKADQYGTYSDIYVTYTVKDEYKKSYQYNFVDNGDGTYTETGTPSKFLIVQNGRYTRTNVENKEGYMSKPIHQGTNPYGGNVYDMILNPSQTGKNPEVIADLNKDGKIDNRSLWYIQPNLEIDEEMGIPWASTSGESNEPLTKYETKVKYKDKTGFDPYNLQFQNVETGHFFTESLSSTTLSSGIWEGTLGSEDIILQAKTTSGYVTPEGYDHTTLQITKQTFMAVSDANGNMQLMPRFDHTKRINTETDSPFYTTLQDSKDHEQVAKVDENSSMGTQTTFFVRPQVFEYHIIDNDGKEALRYRTAGEYRPSTPARFKSPLATDFKYYYGNTTNTVTSGSFATEWEKATETYKRTALTDELVAAQSNLLPATGDYYFRIGTNPTSYTYKKVSVTEVKEIANLFADVGLDKDNEPNIVYVRYSYDESADDDGDDILQGKWFTMNLADKDVQSTETTINAAGDNVFLYADDEVTPTKPAPIDGDDAKRKWQWKFLASPTDISSPYYRPVDPYAIQIFNRKANYTTDLSADPNPMSVGIKIGDKDLFALLSHPDGGYALAVAGLETYSYSFLNGANMTVPSTTPASIVEECYQKSINNGEYESVKGDLPDGVYYIRLNGQEVADVPTYKKVTKSGGIVTEEVNSNEEDWAKSYISHGALLILNDEVDHTYEYKVITNGNEFAVRETQTKEVAEHNNYQPSLPNSIQTPLLNEEDYLYYGSASINQNSTPADPSDDTYTMVDATKLITLYGLYDDIVYVRYNPYSMDKTEYLVPNKKAVDGSGKAIRDGASNDVAMNIGGGLPYNIIWENHNMMESDGTNISAESSTAQDLSGDVTHVWLFEGNDPYALQIKHKNSGKYADGTDALNVSPKNFMLLKKEGYDYGILQVTGGTGKLTGYGQLLTPGDPTKFIIFGLSMNKLIYHLVINKTNVNTAIPYRTGTEESPGESLGTLQIPGTTQRDLESADNGVAGDRYQLGSTINGLTYCVDAGQVSIGDKLEVPTVFDRPNTYYLYYVEGIYDDNDCTTPNNTLNDKYKGLQITKLMSDADLIGKTIRINIAYGFQTGLETNAGEGFVTSLAQNLWYTFEAQDGSKPFLAHYTNAWGLQAMEGRETRYTNDYLWSPLGDVYGFKMYNRYMIKNSGGNSNVMTMSSISEGQNLLLALPSTSSNPTSYPAGNEVFELLLSNTDGYFRIHPVINNTGTQYYIRKDPSDNYAKLSTTSSEWTFNLNPELLEPYIKRKGYVGGLTEESYTANKTVLDKVLDGTASYEDMLTIQGIVYNDNNIVKYKPGYYRLHSQPDVSGLTTVRYASGYLHDTERTGDGVLTNGAIPIHFYSKKGVNTTFETLENGFTFSNATRGPIPVPATEYDPSTIFYFEGAALTQEQIEAGANPTSTMQTQGLYVAEDSGNGLGTNREKRAVMSASSGLAFTLMDIGGAVLLIHDGAIPANRIYLNFDQTNFFQRTAENSTDYDTKKVALPSVGVYYFKIGSSTYKKVTVNALDPYNYSEADLAATEWPKAADIYDLKYYHDSPTDDAKWCMEPANNQGLLVETHSGADGYYYATFYAPYDLRLPDNETAKDYYAYICTEWDTQMIHPVKTGSDGNGKEIPAGTPVIIRTTDTSGSVKLTLPDTPFSSVANNIFTGQYLEQLLSTEITDADKVYAFGLPITGYGLNTASGATNGEITNYIDASQDYTGVGFYLNATPNKELSEETGLWNPNNRYVLHNKIYYRATGSGGSGAKNRSDAPQYVPVIFDDLDEELKDEDENQMRRTTYNDKVYDMQGRVVMSGEAVLNGSWYDDVAPGVYIINGKKILKP